MNSRTYAGLAEGLTAREREHLAVLRLAAITADPDAAKIAVRRSDLLVLLAAVDRLVERPTFQSSTTATGTIPVAFFADSITVYLRLTGADGGADE